MNLRLERCKRSNEIYQQIRSRHYVPNNGAVGQQLHYLILLDREVVGIISAGSAAYKVKSRDDYFGIDNANREVALNGIVNNTVFRLEKNIPNLGTQILKLWRQKVQIDWYEKYGVKVCGFETFVVENDRRKGCLYRADNWDYIGETMGTARLINNGGHKTFVRRDPEKKLIFAKWIKGGKLPDHYYQSWNIGNNVRGQMSIWDFQKEESNEQPS